MDINAITTLIGSIGFPCVMCLYMVSNNNKTVDQNNKLLTQISEMIKHNTEATNELKLLIMNVFTREGDSIE